MTQDLEKTEPEGSGALAVGWHRERCRSFLRAVVPSGLRQALKKMKEFTRRRLFILDYTFEVSASRPLKLVRFHWNNHTESCEGTSFQTKKNGKGLRLGGYSHRVGNRKRRKRFRCFISIALLVGSKFAGFREPLFDKRNAFSRPPRIENEPQFGAKFDIENG